MLQILLFAMTHIGCVVMSFARAPVYAFVLYQAIYFIHPANRWWGYMVPTLPYSFMSVAFMFLLVAVNFRTVKNNRFYKVPTFKWQLLLLLVTWFTYTQAIAPWHHSQLLDAYTKMFIILLLAFLLISNAKHLNIAIWGYLFGAWFSSFIVFQTGRNAGDRVEGVGTVDAPEANGLAAALAPAIVINLYYFWVSRTIKEKAFFAIAGVFTANAIVLINSRASFLAVAISVSYFMWKLFFSSFQRPRQKATVAWIAILGLCGAAYIVDYGFIERMKTIKSEEKTAQKETGKTRLTFWSAAVEVSKDHPLGLGARGFDAVSHVYVPSNVDTGQSRNRSVHSTWLEVLTEQGYTGFILFIFLLSSAYFTLRKIRKSLIEEGNIDAYFKMYALQCSLMCFAVSMTFMNRFRAEILGWLILFVAASYNVYFLKRNTIDKKGLMSK